MPVTPTTPPRPLRVLLLSAYDAASHKRWRTQLVQQLPEFEWTVLALPPRFFSWRLRGNPLTWAFGEREVLAGSFDRIIATSMVDLTALRGLAPHLASIPTLLYFHENQFAYPVREPAMQREVFHFCMHQLLSALCADRILFNSSYNLESMLDGVKGLLKKMPDHVPPGLVPMIEAKAAVLPVPLEARCFHERQAQATGPLQLVWNHRWEYDKAPERLFGAARLLQARGVAVKLHVVGQQFRSQPPAFAAAKESLGDMIGHWGYMEDAAAYRRLLQTCDVAISTALHDFQGLALLEAVAAGCRPLVPHRLAYPQWIPEAYCYASYPDDEESEVTALADEIERLVETLATWRAHPPLDLSRLAWDSLKSEYRAHLVEVGDQPQALKTHKPSLPSS